MKNNNTVIIDNIEIPIENEKNLLELVRKANIELPTFCYLSEMSVYGACRLCMVDIKGRGLCASCSTKPEAGMVVKTNTKELRQMRKMIVELLLAAHNGECTTCAKDGDCQLQDLAKRTGIDAVRFTKKEKLYEVDKSSIALERDPNKCVLCGDCVRMCNEIQGIGAIDFSYRGADTNVTPCFNKGLGETECVSCGQCARVCPTGAIVPKSHTEEVWDLLSDENLTVVAQVAPAVRVALGEAFGLESGTIVAGNMVAALRRMGFAKVFDTSFTADLTIFEEANEFITRFTQKKNLPQFTSCCPAWVKYAEQYYPEFIPNISSCKSPQQMLGSVIKNVLPDENIEKKNIRVISIMPCTAKKEEANKPEFQHEYGKDVDVVLTTRELISMIKEMGLKFNELNQESFDMPFGFKTGGGVIFGNSGGVTEAVIRYASEKLSGKKSDDYKIHQVRGTDAIREFEAIIENTKIRFAIVSGLANAKKLMELIKAGEKEFDFIEVMSCPGGCINGGGQPSYKSDDTVAKRTKGLYNNDKMLQLHNPQDNPYIQTLYKDNLVEPNSKVAHELLHTKYKSRKRFMGNDISLMEKVDENALVVSICFGTSCFLKGAQTLLRDITKYIEDNKLKKQINIKATFCLERCDKGPVIKVGDTIVEHCTLEKAVNEINKQLQK